MDSSLFQLDSMLNLGSLALGLAAWLLPVMGMLSRTSSPARTNALSVFSLSACALSLFLVVLYLGRLVQAEDWSALMDTVPAFRLSASVLLAVALPLNALALFCRNRTKRLREG